MSVEQSSVDDQAKWERQQARNDMISSKMGSLLLQGYSMLGLHCDECGTIIMQSRNKKKVCINCDLLENKVKASSSECKQESSGSSQPAKSSSSAAAVPAGGDATPHTSITVSTNTCNQVKDLATGDPELAVALNNLKKKIVSLSKQLKDAENVQDIMSISAAIKSCSEASLALSNLVLLNK